MRYRYVTADVFTDHPFSGNPLAVFPEAEGLSEGQMQKIAAEPNLSETVFVFPPEDAKNTRRVRIFTPKTELPFAGHPTVGAAHVLAETGEVRLEGERTCLVFEEGVGPVEVSVLAEGGRPSSARLSAAVLPGYGPEPPSAEEVASVLSLKGEDLLGGAYPPAAVSCGVPFLFVPLRDREAVSRARVRRDLWEAALSSYWAPHLYAFSFEGHGEEGGPGEADRLLLHARMFAPAMGIEEDPATGGAATALAGYLVPRERTNRTGTLRWLVEQGVEMGRPSLIEVEADAEGGEVTGVRVGGASVVVGEGAMEAPDPRHERPSRP